MADRYGNVNADSGYWEEAFYNAYQAGYTQILQENIDAYAGTTTEGQIEGENKSYDFVGTIELTEKAARFEDIPIEDIAHNRRWIFPRWFRKGIFVDKEDDIALHTDPTSAYIQALGAGVVRLKNDVVFASFFADVKGGPNPGDDTYSFNNTIFTTGASETGRVIVHDTKKDFTAGGVSTGLTVEKLILAREAMILMHNNPNVKMYIGVSPHQLSDLLREAETQSIDTSLVRSLVAGTIHEYMGFTFIVDYNVVIGATNDLGEDTNVYDCPVWVKQGVLFARHEAPIFKVDRIARKDIFQIAAKSGENAIRMDEDMVLKIECAAV